MLIPQSSPVSEKSLFTYTDGHGYTPLDKSQLAIFYSRHPEVKDSLGSLNDKMLPSSTLLNSEGAGRLATLTREEVLTVLNFLGVNNFRSGIDIELQGMIIPRLNLRNAIVRGKLVLDNMTVMGLAGMRGLSASHLLMSNSSMAGLDLDLSDVRGVAIKDCSIDGDLTLRTAHITRLAIVNTIISGNLNLGDARIENLLLRDFPIRSHMITSRNTTFG